MAPLPSLLRGSVQNQSKTRHRSQTFGVQDVRLLLIKLVMGHDFGSRTTNHCPRITVSHPGQNWVSVVPPPSLRAESSPVREWPRLGPDGATSAFSISFFKCTNKLNQEEMKGGERRSVFSTFFPPRGCSGNSFLCKETEVGSECPPETWSSTRSFWFWEMGLLRWGSLLSFSATSSDLAASDDGRNGTEEGVGKGCWTGRRWISFLWAPLVPEQPPWVFKGPLPMLWAVLQPIPQGRWPVWLQLEMTWGPWVQWTVPLSPSPCSLCPLPMIPHAHTPPQCSPQSLRKEKAGGWVRGEEEELSQCTQEPLGREDLIYTFRTTQRHHTLQKEGKIPLCIYMVFLDSLFWLTLWLHYNSGPFKYTAIITKITGLLWLYFSLVN